MNLPLQHVTVLEEAHNVLKRSPDAGSEGGGLVGKSVEMLTNAIAEMRTYGEGFIIVDQSPHAVDIAAIRNTNTKIIMRLPEEADRQLLGKSVALRDEQLEEIARLPKGVAIVYQNDWLEPVLCKVRKFNGIEMLYCYRPDVNPSISRGDFNLQLAKLLLAARIGTPVSVDTDLLLRGLSMLSLSGRVGTSVLQAIEQYKNNQTLELHRHDAFARLAVLLVDVLGCRTAVNRIIQQASDGTHMCRLLGDLIAEYVPGTCSSLSHAVEHCLMKDYSIQHDHHIDVYSAWRAQYETAGIR